MRQRYLVVQLKSQNLITQDLKSPKPRGCEKRLCTKIEDCAQKLKLRLKFHFKVPICTLILQRSK